MRYATGSALASSAPAIVRIIADLAGDFPDVESRDVSAAYQAVDENELYLNRTHAQNY